MKKTYVTPETELHFILTQDIMVFSFNDMYDKEVDPYEKDLDEWEIKN